MTQNKKLQLDYIQMVKSSKDYNDRVKVKLVENSIDHFSVTIKGVEDTPYKDGKFIFRFIIDDDYPNIPPTVICDTRIWHPNIGDNDKEWYSWGSNVCLHFINHDRMNQADGWNPETFNLSTIISQLILLLDSVIDNDSNTLTSWEDPLNSTAAKQYIDDPKLFSLQALDYTKRYAM